MKKLITIVLVINLFFPSFKSYNHVYQSSLWTYDNQRRGNEKSYDVQFRIGTEIREIEPWTRVRLGLPIKPITIDIHIEPIIIQTRIEVVNLILNLIPTLLLTLILVAWKLLKRMNAKVESKVG